MEPVDKLQVDQMLNKVSKTKKKKIVEDGVLGTSSNMHHEKNNATEMSQNFLLGGIEKGMFGDSQINGNYIEDDINS